jgi:hypothetical protein
MTVTDENVPPPILSIAVELILRAGWLPLLVLVGHYSAARAGGYEVFPALDIPMHLIGGVAVGHSFHVALGVLVRRGAMRDPGRVVRTVGLLAFVGLMAVLWEVAELGVAFSRGTHHRMTLDDTLLDLLLGFLGGAAYLARPR